MNEHNRRMPRWWRHMRARLEGYFWRPCAICFQDFGGQEVDVCKGPYLHTEAGYVAVCPNCASEAKRQNEAFARDEFKKGMAKMSETEEARLRALEAKVRGASPDVWFYWGWYWEADTSYAWGSAYATIARCLNEMTWERDRGSRGGEIDATAERGRLVRLEDAVRLLCVRDWRFLGSYRGGKGEACRAVCLEIANQLDFMDWERDQDHYCASWPRTVGTGRAEEKNRNCA